MNIKLKPIAESKVRQLGGDVCGVLVRDGDGVMAVSEHGRYTRLDAGVMGPVDLTGMSERELFEQRFPVPAGIYWNDISEQYDALPGAAGFDDVEIYHGKWQAWQAARAQGGQGAEAVGVIAHSSDPRGDKPKAFVKWLFGGDETNLPNGTELYIHPQPAQQGGVSEGWRECLAEMVQAMHDYEMSVDEGAPYKHRAMMDRAHVLLSATPQPEGDGWIKCSERLPEQLNREYLVRVNSQIHSRPRMFVAEYNEYGFDRSKVTHWMPLPQPPKEGE